MIDLRIRIKRERLSSSTPIECVARAFRDGKELDLGYGDTPLAAFKSLVKTLERMHPELDQPTFDDAPDTLRTGVEP